MMALSEQYPQLCGHRWTAEVLYNLAYGRRGLASALEAGRQTDESRRKAEADAAALAARGGPSGAGGGAPPAGGGDDPLSKGYRTSALPQDAWK
jgi:hypothetical protein